MKTFLVMLFLSPIVGLAIAPLLMTPEEVKTLTATPEERMADIHQKVFDDAQRQYNIAKQNGQDQSVICVQASMVQAAALQAKNEWAYGVWTQRSKDECAYK
ncbi:MAG: hypothetical protein ACRC62_12325 [Microcoleus sp.]